MPKGFTEREKALIRAKLLEKGRDLFATYGVKKTSVEDLTSAAGISKGAFYLFFDSKEELFFELLEQFEADFKASLFRGAARSETPPRQRVHALLKDALALWKTNALFTHFDREDYEHLLRKLPEEKVAAHTQRDDMSAGELIAEWARAGVAIDRDARLVSNLMRALFFLSLHEQEFDADIYPAVLDVLVGLVAGYLVAE
ncbi:MAG: TetR/AcrR family transcriptional regulator [Kouleothrix sp.]|nr:TetR/AcrR family transcriptional regulator [Kouleothrix sp.]